MDESSVQPNTNKNLILYLESKLGFTIHVKEGNEVYVLD